MNKNKKFFSYKAGMILYRFLASIFFRLGGKLFLSRKYKGDISERLGNVENCPEGSIWVHAVSVGEVQSASSLIRRIKKKSNKPCIISTVTPTGRSMAEKLLNGIVEKIIYMTWDERKFVRKALDNIKPSVYITMETELWPEILSQLKERKVPIFLANGRISDKSFKRLKRTSWFWRGVLDNFNKLMVRFDEDKEKFLELGVPDEKIIVTGDCKVDTLLDRKDITSGEKWKWLKNNKYLFVAGSTHQGEDDVIISAFRILLKKYPDSRLAIVPRHPERALMSIASALPYSELKAELLSHLENKNNNKDFNVVIIDKIGVLFELYAIADAVFVGGSLVQKGGQNPFEPALFGIPAIHGPSMTDFPDTERMDLMGAAICVHNDLELANVWEEAVKTSSREKAKISCEKYFETLGGAAKKTWNEIENEIENLNKN